MSQPSNRQLRRWLLIGLILPIGALNAWIFSQFLGFFRQLLTILALSAVLAFLLNYIVRFLKRLGMRHISAVVVVFLLTVAVFVLLGFILVPVLTNQTTQLLNRIPDWLAASQENLQFLDQLAKSRNLNLDLQGFAGRLSNQINTQLEQQAQDIAKAGFGLAIGTVSNLVNSILIFVLTFYMLLYGDRFWRNLFSLLPSDLADPLQHSLRLNFQNFFLSQFVLALFMTLALIPFFLGLQVPFALLFSLVIGIAELIPLIGATIGISAVSLLLLFQDVGLALRVALVCILLQQVRDNLIAPKLMGDFTGLNPIWVLIVLLIGWQMEGLLGAFLAVPIAGTLNGVIEALRSPPRQLVEAVVPLDEGE
jgi:predicted PurR-regulated permease PerM